MANLNQTFGSPQTSGFSFSTPTSNILNIASTFFKLIIIYFYFICWLSSANTQNFPANSFNFQSNFGNTTAAPASTGLSFGALTTKAPAFGAGLKYF